MMQDDPLAALFDRARRNGVSMAEICREANVDPTTPSRWKRRKNGATVEKLRQLHGALDNVIASRAPQATAA